MVFHSGNEKLHLPVIFLFAETLYAHVDRFVFGLQLPCLPPNIAQP
jgi:hypothetical protein